LRFEITALLHADICRYLSHCVSSFNVTKYHFLQPQQSCVLASGLRLPDRFSERMKKNSTGSIFRVD